MMVRKRQKRRRASNIKPSTGGLNVVNKSSLRFGYVIEPERSASDNLETRTNKHALKNALSSLDYIQKPSDYKLSSDEKQVFRDDERAHVDPCRKLGFKVNQIIDRTRPNENELILHGVGITQQSLNNVISQSGAILRNREMVQRDLLIKALLPATDTANASSLDASPSATPSTAFDDKYVTECTALLMRRWQTNLCKLQEQRILEQINNVEALPVDGIETEAVDDTDDEIEEDCPALPSSPFSGQHWPLVAYSLYDEHEKEVVTRSRPSTSFSEKSDDDHTTSDKPSIFEMRSKYAGAASYPPKMTPSMNVIGFIQGTQEFVDDDKSRFKIHHRADVYKCYRIILSPAVVRMMSGEMFFPFLKIAAFARQRGGYRRSLLAELANQLPQMVLTDDQKCDYVYNDEDQQALVQKQAAEENEKAAAVVSENIATRQSERLRCPKQLL